MLAEGCWGIKCLALVLASMLADFAFPVAYRLLLQGAAQGSPLPGQEGVVVGAAWRRRQQRCAARHGKWRLGRAAWRYL